MSKPAYLTSQSITPPVRLFVLGLVSLLLCLGLRLSPALAGGDVPVRQIPIDYSRMADALRASRVPLHLPRYVVYQLPPGLKRSFYGVKGGPTSEGGYDIYIGHPDCPAAALSCTIATASAVPITGDAAPIEQAFPVVDPATVSRISPDPQGWQVVNGHSVYFVPWVMGASMGFAQTVWDEGGYRYTIALKGGQRDWLLKMVSTAF